MCRHSLISLLLLTWSCAFRFTPMMRMSQPSKSSKTIPTTRPKFRPKFHKGQSNSKVKRNMMSSEEKQKATTRMQKGRFDARCAKESEYFWTCVREYSKRVMDENSSEAMLLSLKCDLSKPIDIKFNNKTLEVIEIQKDGIKSYSQEIGIENTFEQNDENEEETEKNKNHASNLQHFKLQQALCLVNCFKIKGINGRPIQNRESFLTYLNACRSRNHTSFVHIQLIENEIGSFKRNMTLISLFPHSNSKLQLLEKNRKTSIQSKGKNNNFNHHLIDNLSVERTTKDGKNLSSFIHTMLPIHHFDELAMKMANASDMQGSRFIDSKRRTRPPESTSNSRFPSSFSYSSSPISDPYKIDVSLLFHNLLHPDRLGFKRPTVVQQQCLPLAMEELDILACAETGSGKTIAYLLPILSSLFQAKGASKAHGPERLPKERPGVEGKPVCITRTRKTPMRPAALILAPTRELVQQIEIEAKKLTFEAPPPLSGAKYWVSSVYGGAKTKPQLKVLAGGAELLVATPGRLVDFLQQKVLSLDRCSFLVLDEADRMLDMGFEKELNSIILGSDLPAQKYRQTLLFSATFAASIKKVASQVLRQDNFVHVTIGSPKGHASHNVDQCFIPVYIPHKMNFNHNNDDIEEDQVKKKNITELKNTNSKIQPSSMSTSSLQNEISLSSAEKAKLLAQKLRSVNSLEFHLNHKLNPLKDSEVRHKKIEYDDNVDEDNSHLMVQNNKTFENMKSKEIDVMSLIRAAKLGILLKCLKLNEKTLIFVSTKQRASWLARQLNGLKVFGGSGTTEPIFNSSKSSMINNDDEDHYLLEYQGVRVVKGHIPGTKVKELHGDLSQNKRDESLDCFRRGEATVLVSTDVASRGIDIHGINHVIQFDLPTSRDSFHSYIHRVGRSGRAGAHGRATSLFVLPLGCQVKESSSAIATSNRTSNYDDAHNEQKIYSHEVRSNHVEGLDDMIIFRDVRQLMLENSGLRPSSSSSPNLPKWFQTLYDLVKYSSEASDQRKGNYLSQSRRASRKKAGRRSVGLRSWAKKKKEKWDPKY